MEFVDGMMLYYGSYIPLVKNDMDNCMVRRDFGCGLYFVSDELQAESFIKVSVLQAKGLKLIDNAQNYGYITCCKYHAPNSDITVYKFRDIDKMWLDFVALNRRRRLAEILTPLISREIYNSEIIIGKAVSYLANLYINAYINDLYGSIKYEKSSHIPLSLLRREVLVNQYCFLSQRVLDGLKIVEVKRYEC